MESVAVIWRLINLEIQFIGVQILYHRNIYFYYMKSFWFMFSLLFVRASFKMFTFENMLIPFLASKSFKIIKKIILNIQNNNEYNSS